MKHYRSKSVSSSFVLNGSTMSYLRADCLSLLHTLPHPQLNLMPQSSQLQDRERDVRYNSVNRLKS